MLTQKISNVNIFLFTFIIAIITVMFKGYLIIGIGVLLLSFFILSSSQRFFISFAVLSLLTIVGTIGESIRVYVQLISIGLLILLFFKKYAFEIKSYKKIPSRVTTYLVYLFAVMSLSIIFSNHPQTGAGFLVRTLIFFTIVYILYSFLDTRKDILNMLYTLMITCIIITISIIYEFVQSGFFFFNFNNGNYKRVSGLMTNINATAGFFAVTIPLVIGLLFYSEFSRKRKIALSFLLGFLLIGLLFTDTRSAYVSIFISLVIILAVLRKKLLKWLLASAGAVGLLFVFIKPLNNLISLLLRFDEGVAGRGIFWDVSLNIIKTHPLFGIGPGGYKFEMFNYFPVLIKSWYGAVLTEVYNVTGGSNSSHNFFLFYFSDMGILGFIAAISLFVLLFYIGIKLLKVFRNSNEFNFIITLSVISIGAGLFARAFFESIGLITYGYITTDLPFWICFIIIIHFYQNTFPNKAEIK